MQKTEYFLGCLLGAAVGDSIGAPTEMRTKKQIEEYFNGPVLDFKEVPPDTFARGNQPGQVTDDFSMAYVACHEILKAEGKVSRKTAVDAVLEWAKNERFFQQFVGPTSREAIYRLRGDEVPEPPFVLVNYNNRGSNGAAMKASPIALFAKGDAELAIQIVAAMASPTHNNNQSLAGACAVAAATSAALNQQSLEEIVQAGVYGARKGDQIGREKGDTLAGPNMEKRIRWAAQLAMTSPSLERATITMGEYFDCSGMAADSVPVAFGLMVAAKGNPLDAIFAGANVGNDTDTIATMAGGILGAKSGAHAFPHDYIDRIQRMNGYDLVQLADSIRQCGAYLDSDNAV